MLPLLAGSADVLYTKMLNFCINKKRRQVIVSVLHTLSGSTATSEECPQGQMLRSSPINLNTYESELDEDLTEMVLSVDPRIGNASTIAMVNNGYTGQSWQLLDKSQHSSYFCFPSGNINWTILHYLPVVFVTIFLISQHGVRS